MELANVAILKKHHGLRHSLAPLTSNFSHTFLLLLIAGFFAVSCRPFQPEQLDAVQGPTAGTNLATITPAASELTPTVAAASETAQQRTATPEPATSVLVIKSSLPDATVLVNGMPVGRTPYQGTWPTGAYTVTAALPGYQPWQSTVHLEAAEPVTLTAEFTFEPHVEHFGDVRVKEYWWAEDGRSVYFVEFKSGDSYDSDKINGEQPVWQVDLTSGEVSEAEDAWSPAWVPRAFTPLVPDSVPPRLIWVAPSGRRVIFFELIEDPSIPTPTVPTDPRELGPGPFSPEYRVQVIFEDGNLLELGAITGFPRTVTWAEDEELVFIAADPLTSREHDGWLVDLQTLTVNPVVPPIGSLPGTNSGFHNASLLPNGEAILYRPEGTDPFYVWYFKSGKIVELGRNNLLLGWLEDSRYLLYKNDEGIYWYDLLTDTRELVLGRESLRNIDSWSLSPQGDKLLIVQFSDEGRLLPGIELLELDTE